MKRILGVLILLGVWVGLPVAAYGWIGGLLVVTLALAIVGLLMLAARLLEVDR